MTNDFELMLRIGKKKGYVVSDELIIFLATCVLAGSFYIYRYAAGYMNLLKLNMVSYIYYVQLIMFSFIGATLVVLGLSDHYIINRFPNIEFRVMVWGIIAYAILATGGSMALFQRCFFNIKGERVRQSIDNFHIQCRKSYIKHDYKIILVFTILAIFSVAYTYCYLDNLPWVYFIMGAASEAAEARIKAGREFGGIEYVRNIFALGLTPLLCYIAYCYKIYFNSLKYRLLYYSLFVSSVLILIYDAEKAPILLFFLGFLMLDVLLKGKINKKYFLATFILVIAAIIGMYTLLGSTVEVFFSIDNGPLGRIFQSSIGGLYAAFYIFPDMHTFLDGAGMPGSLISLLGFDEHMDTSRMIMEYLFPERVSAGVAGVMNTLFMAEAWSNFGWIGVIIAPIIVGIYWDILYIMFMCYLPKHPFFIGLYAYTCVRLSLTGGFFYIFLNPGYLVLVFIVCIMYKLRRF